MEYTNKQKSKARYQVKKILNVNIANGAYEGEVDSAINRATAIIEKYKLDPAEFADLFAKMKAPKAAKVETKAAPKAKKAKTEKATGGKRRGPAPTYADDMRIHINQANPKRPGSKAYSRFARYEEGMTVAQALTIGITREDFRWDTDKGFIAIETPDVYAANGTGAEVEA